MTAMMMNEKNRTSESGPLSTPGHWNVTNSWHRLCTTKLHTINTAQTHTAIAQVSFCTCAILRIRRH